MNSLGSGRFAFTAGTSKVVSENCFLQDKGSLTWVFILISHLQLGFLSSALPASSELPDCDFKLGIALL